MNFDPTTFELPKNLQALLTRERGAAAPEGLPRRSFLKLTAVSGFALGAFPLGTLAQDAAAPAAGLKPFQQPSAFVHIAADGTTTITINRLDFGQGVQTSLPMILADELDADWSKVKSVHGSSDPAYVDPVFGLHITGGSGSIAHSYTQYRELGARTRAMLISAAAAQWKVDPATLRTRNGVVIGPGGKQLTYGQLAVLRDLLRAVDLLDAAGVPVELERVSALLRGPVAVGDHRHAFAAAVDRHTQHGFHALDGLRSAVVDRLQPGREHRRLRDHRGQHTGQAHIDAIALVAAGLGFGVQPASGTADEAKGLCVLQRDLLRHRQLHRRVGQFAVAELLAAGADDDAVARSQRRRVDV
ncbi:MAG: molybdopterin cofactor-binding domain-containing protein, partial [Rhizobacter sp.]